MDYLVRRHERPHLFTTSKSFSTWLKGRARTSEPNEAYARFLGFKKLLVHSEPTLPNTGEGLQEIPFRRLFRITLPVASEGARWWRELWEGEIVDHRHAHSYLGGILCVTKTAIWNQLPELHLRVPKYEFQVVSEADARAMVGADTLAEMMFELHDGLGIAVRRVKS